MKISQVLLRWHKSFNINYNGYDDQSEELIKRPWNSLNLPENYNPKDFGYIEIPLEADITTVVGANESGKSHLLDAVCKVLIGQGDDDRPASAGDKRFSVTDLCHFSSARSKDANVWPNIGLRFSDVNDGEAEAVVRAATDVADSAFVAQVKATGFVLILAPSSDLANNAQAYVYSGDLSAQLDAEKLKAVRTLLPKVRFLRSSLPLEDEISLPTLISVYGENATYEAFDANAIHEVLSSLKNINISAQNQDYPEMIRNLQDRVEKARLQGGKAGQLETMLFRDVLDIKVETLRTIASLKTEKRSYVENLIGKWNLLLSERLNLARYWQQDPSFALQIDYKGGMLYFEITDKTGSKYTFGERSSGLRYFLSYYIQAKALEQATQEGHNIILMDEPDSFLSTQGQRNLLMVFESLVSPDRGSGNTQLIYTTHSPWLINRNFPNRIRLVRKGDAEEGTQYIHAPILRRYEPVRSALGVDSVQTLFMGATNLVLESTTDQFLLTELIRCFATPKTLYRYLDLNTLVTISADGVDRIEQILVSSKWGDEIQPATVVLVSNNQKGTQAVARLTQPRIQWNEAQNQEQQSLPLLGSDFAAPISAFVNGGFTLNNQFHKVVTLEDIIPSPFYSQAVRSYLKRWYWQLFKEKENIIDSHLNAADFSAEGVVTRTNSLFSVCGLGDECDRYGIASELISLIQNENPDRKILGELDSRLQQLCRNLQSKIIVSEQLQKSSTGESNVRRLLKDYRKGRQSAPIRELMHYFDRIGRDIEYLGEDGDKLRTCIAECQRELAILEGDKIEVLEGKLWEKWNAYLEVLQRETLRITSPPPKREHHIMHPSGNETETNVGERKSAPKKVSK